MWKQTVIILLCIRDSRQDYRRVKTIDGTGDREGSGGVTTLGSQLLSLVAEYKSIKRKKWEISQVCCPPPIFLCSTEFVLPPTAYDNFNFF